jgi:hypothetical protein
VKTTGLRNGHGSIFDHKDTYYRSTHNKNPIYSISGVYLPERQIQSLCLINCKILI